MNYVFAAILFVGTAIWAWRAITPKFEPWELRAMPAFIALVFAFVAFLALSS